MASCTGGLNSPGILEQDTVKRLAAELYKCVKKDQLVKAKIILKGLRKEDKKRIVSITFDGNTPLFVAAQQGMPHFVNYLINDCLAEIEQRGVYEVAEDRSRHQVTPLWCAAVANKLEVVKILIRVSANVNATSDTESTPVRSACYMTNIEVVKYLVENGADIHKPNINGGTCLINSVQSVDLCRYLIEKNANVNAQDNSGNLALHYAIREGRMETVRLLLKHGSDPYVRNDFGDDAIQTAALRGYSDILEFLLYRIKPTIQRQIEAYELMATNFVDEKHDIQQAIQTLRLAMELRYKDPDNIIEKLESIPNAAYQNHIEARTMAELEKIATNPDAVYMQALIIRERILGAEHKDTVFGLMYRGAVYADTHRYQRCVDLWKYAFQLRHGGYNEAEGRGRHQNQQCQSSAEQSSQGESSHGGASGALPPPMNHECLFTLQALCKLFWEIYDEYTGGCTNELVRFDDIHEVFEMSVSELQRAQMNLSVSPVHDHQNEEFHTILLLVLHLINLLCYIPYTDDAEEKKLRFRQTVHRLIKLGLSSSVTGGRSLLHLAVDRHTSTVAEEYYSRFPSIRVVRVLLECGANVNAMDDERNTPLHLCNTSALGGSRNAAKSAAVGGAVVAGGGVMAAVGGAVGGVMGGGGAQGILNNNNNQAASAEDQEELIDTLLCAGAHVDAVNKHGVMAMAGAMDMYGASASTINTRWKLLDYLSLKCLAARAVRRHSIRYNGEVPHSLVAFLEMH